MRTSSVLLLTSLTAIAGAVAPRAQTPVVTPALGRQLIASAAALGRGFSDTAALGELRRWNTTLVDLWRAGDLVRVSSEDDRTLSGRTHEHFAQSYKNIRVWSGDVRRQLNAFGQAESILGTFYPDVDLSVDPAIPAARAAALLADAGQALADHLAPDLTILPANDGFHLAWTTRVVSRTDGLVRRIFVDAQSGTTLLSFNDTWTQTAPPAAPRSLVVDMFADPALVVAALDAAPESGASAASLDRSAATSSDVIASVEAAFDAAEHYFARRFARAGLDGLGRSARVLVNPVAEDAVDDGRYPAFSGAAYFGHGAIVVGPRAVGDARALLGTVAHEWAHGVTEYSSELIYLGESGALNEAFSDVMAVSAQLSAAGADATTDAAEWQALDTAPAPGAAAIVNDGGVHAKARVIVRVFKIAVEELGFARREDLERVMYRAFTALLPANATFNIAKMALQQAALDLYGRDSEAGRALADAWTRAGLP